MDIKVAFGKAIKIRRVELGVSQEELAGRAGFARSFLSAVELGNQSPSLDSVWRLSQELQCLPSDLWLTAERLWAASNAIHEGSKSPSRRDSDAPSVMSAQRRPRRKPQQP